MSDRNKGGRPRQGVEVKRAPLNMRTSPVTRSRLESAAEANGWSLTQEVEHRLERTFAEDRYRGGPRNSALFHLMLASATAIETANNAKWDEDVETFTSVKAAINRLLDVNHPQLSGEYYEAAKALDTAIEDFEDSANPDKGRAPFAEAFEHTDPTLPFDERADLALAFRMRPLIEAKDRLHLAVPNAEKLAQQVREGQRVADEKMASAKALTRKPKS